MRFAKYCVIFAGLMLMSILGGCALNSSPDGSANSASESTSSSSASSSATTSRPTSTTSATSTSGDATTAEDASQECSTSWAIQSFSPSNGNFVLDGNEALATANSPEEARAAFLSTVELLKLNAVALDGWADWFLTDYVSDPAALRDAAGCATPKAVQTVANLYAFADVAEFTPDNPSALTINTGISNGTVVSFDGTGNGTVPGITVYSPDGTVTGIQAECANIRMYTPSVYQHVEVPPTNPTPPVDHFQPPVPPTETTPPPTTPPTTTTPPPTTPPTTTPPPPPTTPPTETTPPPTTPPTTTTPPPTTPPTTTPPPPTTTPPPPTTTPPDKHASDAPVTTEPRVTTDPRPTPSPTAAPATTTPQGMGDSGTGATNTVPPPATSSPAAEVPITTAPTATVPPELMP